MVLENISIALNAGEWFVLLGPNGCGKSTLLDCVVSRLIPSGGEISIADFAIVGWAWRHERHQVDLKDYPNVKRWYEALMARPATQRGIEVPLS